MKPYYLIKPNGEVPVEPIAEINPQEFMRLLTYARHYLADKHYLENEELNTELANEDLETLDELIQELGEDMLKDMDTKDPENVHTQQGLINRGGGCWI